MPNREVYNILKGFTFCFLWYFSIFFGFILLYCPLLPLVLFSNYGFRLYTDKIFAFWEIYPTALLQMIYGTDIFVHGDHIDPDETSLIVMNHRTRVDWNYLWVCMFHATRCSDDSGKKETSKFDSIPNGYFHHQNGRYDMHNSRYLGKYNYVKTIKKKCTPSIFNAFKHKSHLKYVLKDEIRHIPGPGWVMQMNCFTYIRRNWDHDEDAMYKIAKYLQYMNYTYQLLIFPEGTDLTDSSIRKSNNFAKKTGMQPYKHVLHPRTRGFTSLVRSMNPKMAAIYDITVAYSSFNKWNINTPYGSCCLKDMILGNFPSEVHFTIKRYAAENLPKDDELLGAWLNDRWAEKEVQLESFFQHGRFVNVNNRLHHGHRAELLIALVFWTSLVVFAFSAIFLNPAFRWMVLYLMFLFFLLNLLSEGFHFIEIFWFEVKYGRIVRPRT